jgi:hypothetical protein
MTENTQTMTAEEQTTFEIRNNPILWFEIFGTILNRAGESAFSGKQNGTDIERVFGHRTGKD